MEIPKKVMMKFENLMYLTRTYYNCPHAVSENARQPLTLSEHDFCKSLL